MKRKLICFLFLLATLGNLRAYEPKGPLHGKNYYVPFIPFYSFPGDGAWTEEKGTLSLRMSGYYLQDMVAEYHYSGSTLIKERFVDYEGFVLEPTVFYTPAETLETGITTRFHGYYGGIFDPVFEGFHSIFGFPNGGREDYPRGDVYINIVTTSGLDLHLDNPLFALGDTDLYIKWNFLSFSFMDSALFGALKLPTGSMENVSGSGYADLAFSLISDFYFLRRFAFYLENGIVLPGQIFTNSGNPVPPIYHMLVGLEWMATDRFSLLVQFKLNTSPIAEGVIVPENISYTEKLVKPMTDILFGCKWQSGKYLFQISFEEDAFTNNGADLTGNFTVTRSLDLY